LVYDITNYASFDDLGDWLEVVKRVTGADAASKLHLGLVGNKGKEDGAEFYDLSVTSLTSILADLEHRRVVRKERHAKFCKDNKMSRYFIAHTDAQGGLKHWVLHHYANKPCALAILHPLSTAENQPMPYLSPIKEENALTLGNHIQGTQHF
jgi:hypothetical protein